MAETKTLLEIPSYITVRELASSMGVSPINVIKELMANGIMANISQMIDFDTAAIVAGEMGFDVVAQEEAVAEVVEDEEKTGWRKVLAGESEADLLAYARRAGNTRSARSTPRARRRELTRGAAWPRSSTSPPDR